MMFGERKVDLIAEGIDLSVRIGELHDDPEIVARRLGDQHLVICPSPDYLRTISDRTDLLEHDCIIAWRKSLRASWLLQCPSGVEHQEIRVRHEFGDGEMMLKATLEGCGLCQLSTWLVGEQLRSGQLVTVLNQYAGARMPIHVIWPKTRYIQPKVHTVVDELLRMAETHAQLFAPWDSAAI